MTPWDPTEAARYWVVGGGHTDSTFACATWSAAHGPFPTRYEAEACWRKVSFAHTHQACVRFTIREDTSDVARAA